MRTTNRSDGGRRRVHYDAIHHPPVYVQTEDPAGRFLREAEALDVNARIVAPGDVAYEGAPAAA